MLQVLKEGTLAYGPHQSAAGCHSRWPQHGLILITSRDLAPALLRGSTDCLLASTLFFILQSAASPHALEMRIIAFWESTVSFLLLQSK